MRAGGRERYSGLRKRVPLELLNQHRLGEVRQHVLPVQRRAGGRREPQAAVACLDLEEICGLGEQADRRVDVDFHLDYMPYDVQPQLRTA